MRVGRAKKSKIAVSAFAKETAWNTARTPDLSLLVGLADIITREKRTEDNKEELNGLEEADVIYDLGQTSAASWNFEKMQPHHLAFVAAYGMGAISSATLGSGYTHTITPIDGDTDLDRSIPTFSAAMQYGDVFKRLFASMLIDSFTLNMSRDSWVKLTATVKGSGKTEDNVIAEEIEALDNVTALTLAANGVEGLTAAARLDSIHRIQAETSAGVWEDVSFSAVSDATPAEITITSLGGSGDTVTYKVLYIPTESEAWMTFPAMITESPMRVSEVALYMGGKWNGSAFSGGREMKSEVKSIDWTFNNGLEVEFGFGAGGAYASSAFRPARTQTLKMDRFMRDYLLQADEGVNTPFGLRVQGIGGAFTGGNYGFDLVFPNVAVLKAPITVDGKRLAESGDLAVLEGGGYPSSILKVTNTTAAFAA